MSDLRPPAASLRDQAVLMLMRASPVAELDFHDAGLVIDAMQPAFVAAGTVFIEEGQTDGNEFMALLIEGQVRAENATGAAGENMVISLIGAGSLIGEMGLIDGAPRSATCTALSDLKLAILSREALRGLVETQPAIAARLLLAVASLLGGRVRENNRRLRTLSQVAKAMQRELDATHAVNRRLLSEHDSAPTSVNAALMPSGMPALDSGFDTDLAPSNFGPLGGR
ncbi:cyclic nucleotide-binding domain-containing protein [Variovorax sp. N23]|jgi:CRP-like cAMP-binding protein|uniref:cyclic nucleotide-binding domain-containing protein n=1 Tax=Variovorax sp. N23 TaxID=2980555 RepID=UPI0021C7785F|nr:cyclic nucleotide-binding domain-containing protein [Variovorax sp. N23]MCU4118097.1 cyclic nucleotide-binding domain-containing protein [Variovorax sp. N23]